MDKKRPKKNPELGKHFILNSAYKGIAVEDRFLTPSTEVNGKPFAVYDVKSSDTYSAKTYLITLLDLETLNFIYFSLYEIFPYDFSFSTYKTQRLIKSLENVEVYYSPDKPSTPSTANKELNKYRIIDGDFAVYVFKSPDIYSPFKIEPQCGLNLNSISGNNIIVSPIRQSTYSYKTPIFLTQKEYDNKYRVYTIDSNVREEYIASDVEMPFKFEYVLGMPKGSMSHMSQEIKPELNGYELSSNFLFAPEEVMLIGGTLNVRGKSFYKMLHNGKAFFMQSEDVSIDKEDLLKLDSLQNSPANIQDIYLNRNLVLSKGLYTNALQEALGKFEFYKKTGLAIVKWGVYDESQYTDGTGVSITFFNPSELEIKYISVTFQGYNAVEDPYGKPVTKKCVGPIGPDETANYNYEYVWFTDVVESAKIKSIIVTYKNGATKTISNAKSIILSSDIISAIFGVNKVENFK